MNEAPEANATTATLFPIKRVVLDLFLTAGFWVFMSGILRAHVPSSNPFWITVWSCITATCLSGVFFMALQMFRLVAHDDVTGVDKES